MSSIPFDNEGFVDMAHFDATDPDLVPALSEHGLLDDLPSLGDTDWDGLLRDVFQSDATADDALVGDDDVAPFDDADTGVEIDDADTDADPFHLGLGEDDDTDDLGAGTEAGVEADDDSGLDDLDGSDVGSTAGELVSFDDDGSDIGSSAGELVSFDEDEVDFSTTGFDADDTLDADDDPIDDIDFN
jgi:hypothetical protein